MNPWLYWVFDSFISLSTARNFGHNVGPIPWHILQVFISQNGLNDDESDDFERLINVLDQEYLRLLNEKQKKQEKKVKK